jgi:hypothetical protein
LLVVINTLSTGDASLATKIGMPKRSIEDVAGTNKRHNATAALISKYR